MAKIFRISGYLVDANGHYDYDANYIKDFLSGSYPGDEPLVFGQHIHVEEAEFEWHDDLPINQDNCDLAHCEAYFKDLPTTYEYGTGRELPKPGETWVHFKEGKTVVIHSISRNSENPSQQLVTYMCSNGLYTRPLDMFMSKTDKAKYPDAKQEYRFEKLEV